MYHVAILKKSWHLGEKIANGKKIVESRWYKTKHTPWDKIRTGDVIFFKESGDPVRLKATAKKVDQNKVLNNKYALELMNKYKVADLGTEEISGVIRNYITDKNYAIFVSVESVGEIIPFPLS